MKNKRDTIRFRYRCKNIPDRNVYTPFGWAKVVNVTSIEIILKIGTMSVATTDWFVAANGDLYWGKEQPIFNSALTYRDNLAYLDTVRCRWEHRHDPAYLESIQMQIIELFGSADYFARKKINAYVNDLNAFLDAVAN